MKILKIVIKNSSTLDFSLPLFRVMKANDPSIEIIILYCVFNKNEILRHSEFYKKEFDKLEIRQIDLFQYSFVKNIIPNFNVIISSKFDNLPLSEIFHKLANFKLKYIFNFLLKIVDYFLRKVIEKSIKFDWILPSINPDIILFDNRNGYNFPGRNSIYNYMYHKKKPVFLIPHAPHMRDAFSEFCEFDEFGDELPQFCHFLVPLKYGTPWIGRENKKKQFIVSGYPGLDKSWLSYCKKCKKSEHFQKIYNNDKKYIIFSMRRYLSPGVKRDDNTDDYVLSYDEMIDALLILEKFIKKIKYEGLIILKPHPSNNFNDIKQLMKNVPLIDYIISKESIYAHLHHALLLYSLPSTVSLVTAFAGIPTIIVDGRLQKTINQNWVILKEIYEMSSFTININNIDQACVYLKNYKFKKELRKFYSDDAGLYLYNKIKSLK
jgi:hypothetical protein